MVPQIGLYNRQSAHPVDLTLQKARALSALPLCLATPGPSTPHLRNLIEVEVTFVDDEEIARVHLEFMGIPGATDVITFDHGEIVISTETAAAQAANFGISLARELTLYIIHGLLHLNGFEDTTQNGFLQMKGRQEHILEAVVPTPSD